MSYDDDDDTTQCMWRYRARCNADIMPVIVCVNIRTRCVCASPSPLLSSSSLPSCRAVTQRVNNRCASSPFDIVVIVTITAIVDNVESASLRHFSSHRYFIDDDVESSISSSHTRHPFHQSNIICYSALTHHSTRRITPSTTRNMPTPRC
jgi:hypothetical protein